MSPIQVPVTDSGGLKSVAVTDEQTNRQTGIRTASGDHCIPSHVSVADKHKLFMITVSITDFHLHRHTDLSFRSENILLACSSWIVERSKKFRKFDF